MICAYHGGSIYGSIVWTSADDYCDGCAVERFDADLVELFQAVASICNMCQEQPFAIAAE
jgi:hypothetical protein